MAISDTLKTQLQNIINELGGTSIECIVDTGASVSVQLRSLEMSPGLGGEHDPDMEEYFCDKVTALFEESELTLNHTVTGGEKGYWDLIIKN